MLEQRAFEAEFLRKLDGLVLSATRARTRRAGRRVIGRAQGAGIEPENYREYAAGDDLRFLDWNALARLDDLTIRTFRADRHVEVSVLLDASASMGIPERDDKFGLARLLGAGLAYVAMSKNDPVRLAAFGRRASAAGLETTRFYRRQESYVELRPFVTGLAAGGETRMAAAVGTLLNERRAPGMVFVISDFLVAAADYETALADLSAAHHEVKVVHVMGTKEMAGDYPPGAYRIRDCESGATREVTLGPAAAAACRARATAHANRVRAFCASRGITYAEAFGAEAADEIILREFPRLGGLI
ncbi:MAG TPA: DUF58 domain-containing protein [Candidatus Binataceae bacterium]|nr:DUF58 domain-containing protein [Candidatus Binataceae bacterium]